MKKGWYKLETILDRIIEVKKTELEDLKKLKFEIEETGVKRSFIDQLIKTNELCIIAEFKRASPSKGDINPKLNPRKQAKLYAEFGADAISVLTDQTFFKGSFSDLQEVREVVDLPILCKDFMIDEVQIDIAKQSGADLILLIAAVLEENRLVDLYKYAESQNLEILVEIHNERELEKALLANARLIGINNRNLRTFEVDLAITEQLAPLVKKTGAFLISESGIKSLADVSRVNEAGASGILVGERLMTASNLKGTFKEFKLPLWAVK
jgi:indole-3-glycerol phosphate synthase